MLAPKELKLTEYVSSDVFESPSHPTPDLNWLEIHFKNQLVVGGLVMERLVKPSYLVKASQACG